MVHVPEQDPLPAATPHDIGEFMQRYGVYNFYPFSEQQRLCPISVCGEWADMGDRWEIQVTETNLPEAAYPYRVDLAPFTNLLRVYKDTGVVMLRFIS